jgi:hypothetical protein
LNQGNQQQNQQQQNQQPAWFTQGKQNLIGMTIHYYPSVNEALPQNGSDPLCGIIVVAHSSNTVDIQAYDARALGFHRTSVNLWTPGQPMPRRGQDAFCTLAPPQYWVLTTLYGQPLGQQQQSALTGGQQTGQQQTTQGNYARDHAT